MIVYSDINVIIDLKNLHTTIIMLIFASNNISYRFNLYCL